MTLEILLVKNDSVLFRFPLDSVGDGLESLSDSEIERISALYTIGANRKRLKVMLELAKGNEMRFSEVMQIVMNPKLAQDCLQPLLKEGLVLHGERGSTYRASRRGLALVAAMTLGVGQMLDVLEQEMETGP
jgi:predicted transcriptional regulator